MQPLFRFLCFMLWFIVMNHPYKGILSMDTYQKYGSLDNAITTYCNFTGT